MEKPKTKSKAGDVRPLLQQVGFQVCKDSKKDIWIDVEKICEAEILSYLYKEEE